MKLIITSLAILLTLTSYTQTTKEISDELENKYKKLDKELNIKYSKLLELYKQDTLTINSLKKSQRAWILYRDTYANFKYDLYRDGTIRGVEYISVKLELTEEKIKQFDEILSH